ncbi:MAG: single-stranded-DNA-specific exonuclease RecJ, partial [Flavobacteriales bacterium]
MLCDFMASTKRFQTFLCMVEKRWIPKNIADPDEVSALRNEVNLSETTARLLVRLGLKSQQDVVQFFNPQLDQLHDPFLMRDMDKAVNRVIEALHSKQKIMVYGDYDVDGTTAVSLMLGFLQKMEADCFPYIPDRYEEGYGFSFKGVEEAVRQGVSLIITLDCGIKDGAKIDHAQAEGIDVIVCDHHQPEELPLAFAVLNPKRNDCLYPYKGLSGCGVGFKLICAICDQLSIPRELAYAYLDLVTIAIGADIVPMTGENRVLAFHGLAQLAQHRRPGIEALLNSARHIDKPIGITEAVFLLAPRINAAGRIFSGRRAVELLMTTTAEEAESVAAAIEENNRTRKALDKSITAEAIEMVRGHAESDSRFGVVVAHATWHKGVVGIVAARLVEAFYKPSIVLVEKDGVLSGSARSIPGIDLYDILQSCEHCLSQFGGHTMAAGLSLPSENLGAFQQAFSDAIGERLNHEFPVPFLEYDEELPIALVQTSLFHVLQQMEPFGPENMRPVFLAKNVISGRNTKIIGGDRSHLRVHLMDENNREKSMEGVAFFQAGWYETLS